MSLLVLLEDLQNLVRHDNIIVSDPMIRSLYKHEGLIDPDYCNWLPSILSVVEINMRDPSMRAGQKAYDRFRHCLECFPGNPFSAWLAPQAIQQTRRWEVMMSYVNVNGSSHLSLSLSLSLSVFWNVSAVPDMMFGLTLDSLEDVILPLDPLNTQSERCRSKIVDVQKPFPSPWSTPSRLESTSDLIELYEHLGASLLSTCDSYPSTDESPMTPIRTISARGFFHPISICQYARQLVISHGVCSLTSHISPLAPFSFLHRQQVTHPQPMAMKSQPAKRQKKGKGAMRGPERGIHAGPTSWTLICFPQEDITRTVVIQEDRQPKQETVDRLHKRGRGRESDEGDGSRDDEEGVENSEMVKRRWVLYESVGEDDTHC